MQTRREMLRRCVGALAVSPPYLDRRESRVAPGSSGEAPADPDREISIGYFGPRDSLWRAACAGFDQVNREGGYCGKPFRLVQKWTADPWKAGGKLVVEMAYIDRVLAIVGSIDATSTHVAEQVAVKARVPLIDAVSTDRTTNAAMVPWMFSCQPPDDAVAAAVGARLLAELDGRGFTLVSATSHDERILAQEFARFFARHKVAPERHVEFTPGQPPEFEAPVAVVAASPSDGAAIARQLRGALVYGGASFGRREFLREAGAAAEGVRYPVMGVPVRNMDYAEAQSYDAARMLAAAVERGGPSRENIRAALEEISPWPGRGGEVRWNALNRNARPVACGVLHPGNEWESSVIKESRESWN